MFHLAVDGRLQDATLDVLKRDEEGFLVDANDWHPGLIEPLAAEAGLTLTKDRLEIIHYVRNHFEPRILSWTG